MIDRGSWKKPFYVVWAGQSVSLVGSSLVQFAIIWWLAKTAGSATVMSITTLVGLVPTIALAPLVGTLVDRWRRRLILIISDVSIALFTFVLVLLFMLDLAEFWHVYLVLFFRALGAAFHEPAMLASTTLMVPKDRLSRIEGFNQIRMSIAHLSGLL